MADNNIPNEKQIEKIHNNHLKQMEEMNKWKKIECKTIDDIVIDNNISIEEIYGEIIEPTTLSDETKKKMSLAHSKLTDEMKGILEDQFSLDAPITAIASACGVTRQTIYEWKKVNKEYFEYLERLREVPYDALRRKVFNEWKKDAEFALKILERKRPDEFWTKNKNTLDINNKIEHIHSLDKETISALSGKELDERIFALIQK